MLLKQLKLITFRCIRDFEADIPAGRVLIVGDNASGKTTLLEAIYYLVTGRSFRTRSDSECIPWDADDPRTHAVVRGRVHRRNTGTSAILVSIGSRSKSVQIDQQSLRQLGDLWGRLNAVLFTPDDLQLIKGGPSERRRYLDIALSQVSRTFLEHLQRYSRALKQRNALLRQSGKARQIPKEQIAAWDAQLMEHAIPVIRRRQAFINSLGQRVGPVYASIVGDAAPGEENLTLEYQHCLRGADLAAEDAALAAHYEGILQSGLEDDLRRGQTSSGPHRDEMRICLGGKSARDFASQGQARSCALALRLAEVREMQALTGEAPVVLLDDLASELDPGRKRRVIEQLDRDWQVFLTTTRREDFSSQTSFDAIIEFEKPGCPILKEEDL